MMLTCLREGENSERWDRHVDALRLLIWSGLPKNGADQRQKLLKTIPALLKRLQEGLQEIGFDMNRAGELFNGLKSCHRAILTGKDDLPWVPVHASETDSHAEPSVNTDDKGATDLGNLPELGEWLKWEEDGVTYRGKLAWMSSITGVCIFVNRDGMKIAEMSNHRLSGLIEAGNAKTVPAQRMPLLDEMLETMQKALGR
jgi:hypothetical protein